ncbi:MAG: TetR/AcrR family transcriptional regulator [Thermoguttaceae bacterium]|jgi:AcrR family transcriptional regulator
MADAKLDTQVRREQIAEAALGLIAADGLKRLSIAAVARRVGLVPSGIYRHFQSKDEVLDAVLDLLEEKIQALVEAARAETADPLERLRCLLVRHVRFIREGRAFPRIIFSDDVFSGHPERKAQVRRIATGYLGHVERMVREGQEQGRIRRQIAPETAAMMFLGMIVPAGILWHLTDGGFNVTQHAGRAWEMFEAALTKP